MAAIHVQRDKACVGINCYGIKINRLETSLKLLIPKSLEQLNDVRFCNIRKQFFPATSEKDSDTTKVVKQIVQQMLLMVTINYLDNVSKI